MSSHGVLCSVALLSCTACSVGADPSPTSDRARAPIIVGERVGDVRLGMTYGELVDRHGEAVDVSVVRRFALADYPELDLQLLFGSPDRNELTADAVLLGIRVVADTKTSGAVQIGVTRAAVEDALGESPDVVGSVHYYPDGVAIQFDAQGVVEGLALFEPYHFAPEPPEMLPAASRTGPFEPASPGTGAGLEVMGETVDIVDTHIHTGAWGQQPRSAKDFLSVVQPRMYRLFQPAMTDAFFAVYGPTGIRATVGDVGASVSIVYATYAQHTIGYSTNRQVEAWITDARNDGWAVGLASVNTDGIEDPELRARRVAALASYFANHPGRFVGIKLAHAHQGVAFDDEVLLDVYDVAADYGVPVLLHTGISPFPNSHSEPEFYDPSGLRHIIARYDGRDGRPRVEFVLAHVGQGDARSIEAAFQLVESFDNVWLELSALRAPVDIGLDGQPSDDTEPQFRMVLRRVKDLGLIDRIFWGSDGPQYPGYVRDFALQVTSALVDLGYTVDEIRALMGGNARRLYFEP